MRHSDLFLEVMRGEQRLVLPHHCFDTQMMLELAVEPSDHPLRNQPLGAHVGG
jgi:hypothetical protein